MQSTSLSEYIARGLEDNIFNFTHNGDCIGCGNCCSNILPMSEKEIKEIKWYVKKHRISECKHNIPLAKESLDLICPFLDMNKQCEKCRIYPVRPMICRKFICDSAKRAKLTRAEIGKTRRTVDVRETFFGESEVI